MGYCCCLKNERCPKSFYSKILIYIYIYIYIYMCVCAFKQFSKKLLYIFLWYIYEKKKGKVFTRTCVGLKSFQWKLFMLWSLNFKGRCCPNEMANSLGTKTEIKKILYSDWLPNLSIFPLHRALEIGEISSDTKV